jgi:TonB family protein
MIALALAAALAAPPASGNPPPPMAVGGRAAPADTAVRVPGTWLRFGYTQDRVLVRASFPLAEGPKNTAAAVRQGPAYWFGFQSKVTLTFKNDRLEVIEFVIDDTAPYWIDYLHDQLRLAGYRSSCPDGDPTSCDWSGGTTVHLELKKSSLDAKITPAAPIPEPARAHATPARRDTVPVFPQVFVLGRPAPGIASPALADSTPLVTPAWPPRARDAGVQGRVWVRALVDTNGAVTSTEIVRSIAELDSAAAAVAMRCRFHPYPPQGARVRFRVDIPVIFMAR